MSEGVTASEQSPLPGIWRGVRWGLAFVLLVLYGLAVFSRLYSECTIARTATTLRATCAPPTVTSSTAIVLLALVLVLLLPDLLRLRVGAGMRDRLERVEQSSRATQRDVDELSNAVLDVRPHAVPVQVAQADPVEEEIARWGREQSARLEEEWRRIGADDPTLQGVRAADVSSEAERRYRTVGELALRWERLRQLLRLTPHLAVAVDASHDPDSTRRQWVRQSLVQDLEEPLATLRDLRAAAVASSETPQTDIDRGVQLLRDLTDTVEEALERRQR